MSRDLISRTGKEDEIHTCSLLATHVSQVFIDLQDLDQ
jgi:hypothetical protein